MDNHLPLATVDLRIAFSTGKKLMIYVEGRVGFMTDSLVIEKSLLTIQPPRFTVYEEPGNHGPFPERGTASPPLVRSHSSRVFDLAAAPPHVEIVDAAGSHHVAVFQVDDLPPPEGVIHDAEKNWMARIDLMPPGPGRLRVEGSLTLPVGYRVTLEKVESPAGEETLTLLKRIHRPHGRMPELQHPVTASYAERTNTKYKYVLIIPDELRIEVSTSH